jgi:hypothetical protein
MKMESLVRVLAGTLVLFSLALTYFFNPWWLVLAAFVGVNLIQSAFTEFCFAEIILRKLRLGSRSKTDAVTAQPRARQRERMYTH